MSEGTEESVSGRETLQAWGAALVTVVLWASAFVEIRAAGKDLSPGVLSLSRLLVGSAVLGAFVLFRHERFPARRDLPAIALCGVLWFGLYNVVLNAAERLADAGTAAMLVGVGPVLIVSRALFISEYTVQDHLSHVFDKVGVRGRRALLKRLFFDNLYPELIT